MRKICFTSDTHFSQKRTLELTRRPFNTLHEMDETIINNFNKEANNENDLIIHLGDFGNFDKCKELKAKVILILGNYEERDMNTLKLSFDEYKSYLKDKYGFYDVYEKSMNIKIDGDKSKFNCHLTHKPDDCKKEEGEFNLFGHIHRAQMIKKYGLNVGCDVHFYQLVTEDVVRFYKNALDKKYYDSNVFD